MRLSSRPCYSHVRNMYPFRSAWRQPLCFELSVWLQKVAMSFVFLRVGTPVFVVREARGKTFQIFFWVQDFKRESHTLIPHDGRVLRMRCPIDYVGLTNARDLQMQHFFCILWQHLKNHGFKRLSLKSLSLIRGTRKKGCFGLPFDYSLKQPKRVRNHWDSPIQLSAFFHSTKGTELLE